MYAVRDKRTLNRINEILLYVIMIEFHLFGSVWAMINVRGIPYLLLYWGFVGLALLKLCIQGNTWKEWLFIIGFGVIAVCSWKGSDDKTPLLLMLGVCCSKGVNLDRLIKIDLIVRIFSTISLIVLPVVGLAANHAHVWHTGRYRDYFGWEAPNGMGLAILIICMEWMFLRHLRFKWYDYAGMLLLNIFLNYTANSRFAELLIMGVIAAEFVSSIWEKTKLSDREYLLWTAGCAGALALAVLAPLSAIILYIYQNAFLMGLKGSLLSRFQIAGKFYAVNGISLFGHPYNPEVYDYLDMSFAYLSLHLGIAIALIVFVLMIGTIVRSYQRKDTKLLLIFMFVLLRSVFESEHFTLVYSFFPILLGTAVWNQESVS